MDLLRFRSELMIFEIEPDLDLSLTVSVRPGCLRSRNPLIGHDFIFCRRFIAKIVVLNYVREQRLNIDFPCYWTMLSECSCAKNESGPTVIFIWSRPFATTARPNSGSFAISAARRWSRPT